MTISSSTASASYTGNGTTTAFTIPFYFLVDTDVKISQKNGATGAITVLTLNSDYTLTGAGNQAGGTATLTVAPLGGATPDQLFIERNVDAVQNTAYPPNSPFPAASHEKALDRLTMLVQQILSKLTFGLFRNPLAATYDLGGNTLSNIANAVNAQDVPSLSQVNQLVTGAASGLSPADVALYSSLASTTSGKGAALIGWPAGFGINQPATNQFFVQNGAAIQRFNDRVFVGDATVSDGRYPQATNDWLSAFYNANGYNGYVLGGMLCSLTNSNSNAGTGILGAARSSQFGSPNGAAIGMYGVGINNNSANLTYCWGGYFEAHQISGTGGGAVGVEISARNMVASMVLDPYNTAPNNSTIALQLSCGAGVSATGQFNGTAAQIITNNPLPWNSGIVFRNGSLAANGTTGFYEAISFAQNYGLHWYSGAGALSGRIFSGAANNSNATFINFSGSGIQFGQMSNNGIMGYLLPVANAVNYWSLQPAATGGSVILGTGGSDTNIDISIVPKGTGNVRFGTYTATAPSATGYITIKDASGTVRKLLCA